MSTMPQTIRSVEDRVRLSSMQPATGKHATALSRLKAPFHLLTGLFVSPLLALLAVLGFFVVLGDFVWFRVRDLRHGHSQPKGLWEF